MLTENQIRKYVNLLPFIEMLIKVHRWDHCCDTEDLLIKCDCTLPKNWRGKPYSLRLESDQVWRCGNCKREGDNIALIEWLKNCSQEEVVEWINKVIEE